MIEKKKKTSELELFLTLNHTFLLLLSFKKLEEQTLFRKQFCLPQDVFHFKTKMLYINPGLNKNEKRNLLKIKGAM